MNTCKALRMVPGTWKVHHYLLSISRSQIIKGHQRVGETVASSLGWEECGKLQDSSAKQERGGQDKQKDPLSCTHKEPSQGSVSQVILSFTYTVASNWSTFSIIET